MSSSFPKLIDRLQASLGLVSANRRAVDAAETGADYPHARTALLKLVDVFERQVTKFSVGVGSARGDEAALASLCESAGKHGDALAAAAVVAQACTVSDSLWQGITTPVEQILSSMVDLAKFAFRADGGLADQLAREAGKVLFFCKEAAKIPKSDKMAIKRTLIKVSE